MKRKEQIDKAALEYANKSIRDKGIVYLEFKEAVEWADRSMIDRGREWVKNAFIGPFGEGLADRIADEFVKSMEE